MNTLLAAIKEEEKGGREDWESRIPGTLETLQNNSSLEMVKLFQELNLNVADRRKMTLDSRKQVGNWMEEERRIHQLMEANDIEEMQVQMNYVLQPEIFRHSNKIRAGRRWSDEATSTEESLWERVNTLVDMWRWYGEAIRMEERDVLNHWKKWLDWQEKARVPQCWLPGWTPEMIARVEADTERTLDLWLWRDGWTAHYLTFPQDADQQEVNGTVARYVRSLWIRTWTKVQLRGRSWYYPSVEDLRKFPCTLIWPTYNTDEVIGWDEHSHQYYKEEREDDPDETNEKVYQIWCAFGEAKEEKESQATLDNYAAEAKWAKMRILEYRQIRDEIEDRTQRLLVEWLRCHATMDAEENRRMFQELEVKVIRMVRQEGQLLEGKRYQSTLCYMKVRKQAQEWQIFGRKLIR
jgi:hypothetical protein